MVGGGGGGAYREPASSLSAAAGVGGSNSGSGASAGGADGGATSFLASASASVPAPAAAAAAAPGSTTLPPEALSCVLCRSRKLKCCRTKPACTRCTKLKVECVYPESRRKPAFKRRNVRELESRLAHVEDLLKDAAKARAAKAGVAANKPTSPAKDGSPSSAASAEDVTITDALPTQPTLNDTTPAIADAHGLFGLPPPTSSRWTTGKIVFPEFDFKDANGAVPGLFTDPVASSIADGPALGGGAGGDDPIVWDDDDLFADMDLMGMGMFESLPPFEVIEELHGKYFPNQHNFIPLVHPGRYLQAFHGPPHMRPPMCLQYAIWAMAAIDMEKYSGYHDVFYRRARQYLEADELRGVGEHFITVAHAQAWCLVSTYEARRLLFTRASMSCTRAARLCHMMGLHRLDDPAADQELAPTLVPPTSWLELEERRRTFWAVFCANSHASIATGWPNMIDASRVTTFVPCSEEAFVLGKEEQTRPLSELFAGPPYSTFAGAVGICHIFGELLAHAHHERPDDHPEDLQNGRFWQRHRDLDNLLASAFMFLPERLRLPKHIRNPACVHTNLNLHASVICLHMAACDRAGAHGLPEAVARTSRARLLMAAQEIINIMKLNAEINLMLHNGPLVALSLYCALSVYLSFVSRAGRLGPDSDNSDPFLNQHASHEANLEYLLECLVSLGRTHAITRAFVRQTRHDLDYYKIKTKVKLPDFRRADLGHCGGALNVPLLARTLTSAKQAKKSSPLPGYLPLGKPLGYGTGLGEAVPKPPLNVTISWPYGEYPITVDEDIAAATAFTTAALTASSATSSRVGYGACFAMTNSVGGPLRMPSTPTTTPTTAERTASTSTATTSSTTTPPPGDDPSKRTHNHNHKRRRVDASASPSSTSAAAENTDKGSRSSSSKHPRRAEWLATGSGGGGGLDNVVIIDEVTPSSAATTSTASPVDSRGGGGGGSGVAAHMTLPHRTGGYSSGNSPAASAGGGPQQNDNAASTAAAGAGSAGLRATPNDPVESFLWSVVNEAAFGSLVDTSAEPQQGQQQQQEQQQQQQQQTLDTMGGDPDNHLSWSFF